MTHEIFIPMYYLMWLTIIVFLISTTLRLKEIYLNKFFNQKQINGEEHRHPPFDTGSRLLKNAQRNLANLFEIPILFYIVCVSIYVTNLVDDTFIELAYIYVYLRIAHSVYHILFNQLIIKGGFPLRSFIWVPSTGLLVWMWSRFILLLT